MEKEYNNTYDGLGEKTLYYEEPEYDKVEGFDETQKFCSLIIYGKLNKNHGVLIETSDYTKIIPTDKSVIIKRGAYEILDFEYSVYRWFEIYKNNKQICFGYLDSDGGSIRWFIEKEEVLIIKNTLKT